MTTFAYNQAALLVAFTISFPIIYNGLTMVKYVDEWIIRIAREYRLRLGNIKSVGVGL